MSAISLANAKARFSELIRRVEDGESIGITRRGKPVARLSRPRGAAQANRIGQTPGLDGEHAGIAAVGGRSGAILVRRRPP
jgi:antitoxin (DNA-binding transcriptional repressor) of toxin-antitoxin stability system